ncbi:hypothetical protein M8J77_017167 [Diaphorina citri]|nr:hypothetical protein M8J77_017167 [Diaphorina citri]
MRDMLSECWGPWMTCMLTGFKDVQEIPEPDTINLSNHADTTPVQQPVLNKHSLMALLLVKSNIKDLSHYNLEVK